MLKDGCCNTEHELDLHTWLIHFKDIVFSSKTKNMLNCYSFDYAEYPKYPLSLDKPYVV